MTDGTNRFSGEAEPTEEDRVALAELVLTLRREGLSDRKVLAAMEAIPRRLFLDRRHREVAYRNAALPIECGQTISQPTVVAMMTEALDLEPHHRVLEVGTGSGYQAAVLSRLAGKVITIERYGELALLARERLEALGADNVAVRVGDGGLGAPEEAPFDRIIVTAAAEALPEALLEQLAEDGILVAPLGRRGGVQTLDRLVKRRDGIDRSTIASVRFVPLEDGVAENL